MDSKAVKNELHNKLQPIMVSDKKPVNNPCSSIQ